MDPATLDWDERADAAIARYRGGEGRDLDQRQLTQLGNAAWAAGLCLLAAGAEDDAAVWLHCAAERYRESWPDAPPDSWGRPIGAMKSLLLAGDDASPAARWALDAGAADAESPIGRYAATLALLVLGDGAQARIVAPTLAGRDDFPGDVAAALAAIAFCDGDAYAAAVARRAPLVRDAHGVPRGRARRGHGARAPGAGRAPRNRREAARVATPALELSPQRRGRARRW